MHFKRASGMSACGQELQWQLALSLQQDLAMSCVENKVDQNA